MGDLRTRSRLYLALLSLAALASVLVALPRTDTPTPARAALAVLFAALLALAYLFPLEFAPGTKVTLGTSVLFASVLLLEPGIAMLAAAAGRLLPQAVRPRPADQALLNGSQTVLQAGVGAAILRAAGWNYGALRLTRPEQLAPLAAAALAMYLINTLAVAAIVGLESGRPPLSAWAGSLTFPDATERLSQLALGLVGAIVADAHAWALPLLLAPAVAVYRLAERNARLHGRAWLLEHRAHHDPLTGLPNRVLFSDRLAAALDPDRGADPVAVLYVDLDDLKGMNDARGHRAGDALLAAVAGRLAGCLRPGDIAARLGGDEFAVLLAGVRTPAEAIRIAERIRGRLAEPVALDGGEVRAGASVGFAVGAPGVDAPEDLLHRADVAMYAAKSARPAPHSRSGAAG